MGSVTPRQRAVLETYLATGSYRATAAELGVSYQTVRDALTRARLRLGCDTTSQVVYRLTLAGELEVRERDTI